MTSLTRSALARVEASRCWRCKRIFRYPRRAKITTMTASRDPINFALMLWVSRFHPRALRFGSVSGMAQRRCSTYAHGFSSGMLHHRVLFSGKDRQVLHRQPEQGEACRANHAGHGELGPLRQVVMPGISLKAGEADIEPVGDESEQTGDRSQIQAVWR